MSIDPELDWWKEDAERLNALAADAAASGTAFGLSEPPPTIPPLNPDGGLSGEWVENVFCPTGAGGGVDPTCSTGGKGSTGAPTHPTAPGKGDSRHVHPSPDKLLEAMSKSAVHQDWATGSKSKASLDPWANGKGEDEFHAAQLKEKGFDAPPKRVSKAEMDQAVKNGALEMGRGWSKPEFVDQYDTGPLFGSLGIYGNGTYAAYGEPPIAKQYKDALDEDPKYAVARQYAGKGGAVSRMALDASAKVIKYEDAKKAYDEFHKYMDEQIKKQGFGLFGAKKAEKQRLKRLKELYGDVGRWASMAGYDAVDHTKEKFMVLLNRGKVLTQKELHWRS